MIKLAHEAISRVDLSSCARYLEPDYGVRTACAWLHDKFGVEVAPDEVRDLDPAKFTDIAHERANAAYDQRESEYPVLAGLYRFSVRGAGGQKQGFLREDLVEWAKRRFGAELSVDDLKNKQRDEIRAMLVEYSQRSNERANQVAAEAQQRVAQLFADEHSTTATLGAVTGQNGKLDDLTTWLKSTCDADVTSEELARLDREAASRRVSQVVEDRFRPEMRRMEAHSCCRFSIRPGRSICSRWIT